MPKKTHDVPLSAQALEEKFDNNGDTDADFDWAAARRPGEGVGGQRTEDRGQRTEDRGQRTEDRGQRTEDRRQRTEDRGQRTEDRGQKTEDG